MCLLGSCGLEQARTPGAAVSSSRPWWYRAGVTSCGIPAMVRADGQVMSVGSCAGLFGVPAQHVTVQVGQQIDVRMTEEPAGPAGNQLVPVFPLPRSSRPAVLADSTVSPDRASGTYQAIRPGHAVLTTRAWCLVGGGEIRGRCPVLDVTVVSPAQPGAVGLPENDQVKGSS